MDPHFKDRLTLSVPEEVLNKLEIEIWPRDNVFSFIALLAGEGNLFTV